MDTRFVRAKCVFWGAMCLVACGWLPVVGGIAARSLIFVRRHRTWEPSSLSSNKYHQKLKLFAFQHAITSLSPAVCGWRLGGLWPHFCAQAPYLGAGISELQ